MIENPGKDYDDKSLPHLIGDILLSTLFYLFRGQLLPGELQLCHRRLGLLTLLFQLFPHQL
jgi:hypothetical protein